MNDYDKLLNNAFTYKPKNGVKAPAPKPFIPKMAKAVQVQEDAMSLNPPVEEEPVEQVPVTADNMAFVQAAVWGQGNVPPAKAPTNKMLDRGSTEAMKPETGWGQN